MGNNGKEEDEIKQKLIKLHAERDALIVNLGMPVEGNKLTKVEKVNDQIRLCAGLLVDIWKGEK